jgi:hypothetical protein
MAGSGAERRENHTRDESTTLERESFVTSFLDPWIRKSFDKVSDFEVVGTKPLVGTSKAKRREAGSFIIKGCFQATTGVYRAAGNKKASRSARQPGQGAHENIIIVRILRIH